ncbi:MAG: hypothetical protein GY953_35495, partial [bacterium]|nr:hypothetical protein [bacterium]
AVGSAQQNRFFQYSGAGPLIQERHPELGVDAAGGLHRVQYEHDSRGNVVLKRIRELNDPVEFLKLSYTYDTAERLTQVRDAGPNNRLLKEFFYYPNVSNPAGEWNRNKLYQAKRHNYGMPTPPEGAVELIVTESYRYGGVGGRVSERQTRVSNAAFAAASVFHQNFEYDALGNVTELGYPECLQAKCASMDAPRTVSYGYDQGRLTSVSDYASAITYHPNGLIHTVVHTNGVTDTQAIADNGMARPLSLSASGASSWISGNYAYDSATFLPRGVQEPHSASSRSRARFA